MAVPSMPRLTVIRLSVAIAGLIALLRVLEPLPLELLELRALDYRHLVRGRVAAGGEVVIVGIDERSLEEVGRWPWSRPRLGELIERLDRAGAAIIGLDIILDRPDSSVDLEALRTAAAADPARPVGDLVTSLGERLESDAILAAALRRSGRVVLGHFFELAGGAPSSGLDLARVPEVSVRATGGSTIETTRLTVARDVHTSVPALALAASGAGHLNVVPDADGINRRVPLVIRAGDRLTPALGVEVVRRFLGGSAATVLLAPEGVEGIRIGDRGLPVDAQGMLWVSYLGPPGVFRHVSAAAVLADELAAGELDGRIALVGFTAIGFDEIATPFHPVVPGVELQATAIDNMLRGRSLRRPGGLVAAEAVLIVALGLGIGGLLGRYRGAPGWIGAAAIAAGYLWATQTLFTTHGVVLSAVYPLAAIAACALAAAIYQAVTEEREKRKIRDAFRHYLNPEVTDLLAADPAALRLGGERRDVTVFFSDIRDFTTIAEGLSPETLGRLLNEYLGAMTDVVFRHQGLLDKYIGDAIMAFWGAPLSVPDHARRCCLAALDMQGALGDLHRRWRAEGLPILDIRAGINSGEAIVGNFGSAQRFSYTAVGDDVNLASRLEGVNKQYGTRILISDATRCEIGTEFVCRSIDTVRVKGKEAPVVVHELLGLAADDHDGRLRGLAAGFEEALSACRAGDWAAAAARLEGLAAEHPGDGAIARFLARCHASGKKVPAS
jgi:adenylate cyclase